MKFMTRTFFLALGLAVVMLGGCGSEQSEEQVQPSQTNEGTRPMLRCEEQFKHLDTNQDGKVTFEEFGAVEHPRGMPEEIFKSRDLDADGVLTEEEFCESRGMGQGTGRRGAQ